MNSGQIDIGKSIRGFVEVHLLNTGVALGLFPLMADKNGLTPAELATSAAIPERVARIWCNTAFAYGVLNRKHDRFSLKKELIESLASDKSTKYVGDFLQILVGYLGRDMENQSRYCRDGKLFPFTEHDVEFVRLIVRRGAQRGRLFLEKIIPMVSGLREQLVEGTYILDVGCGGGSFLLTLAKEFECSRYVGLDVCEKSIGLAREACREAGLTERVDFIHGNPERLSQDERFDLVTMNLVLHEMEPKQRLSYLRLIHEHIKPDGRLLLLEFPYPEQEEDFFDPQYSMGIVDQYYEVVWGTEHLTWTGQQEILAQAGFSDVNRTFLGDNTYVLISAQKGKAP